MQIGLLIISAIVAAMAILATAAPTRKMVAAMIAHVMVYILWATQKAAPALVQDVTSALTTILGQTRPTFNAAAAAIIRELLGVAPEFDTAFLSGPGGAPATGAAGAFDSIAKLIADTIAPPGELTPESGMQNLSRLFGIGLGASLQSWFIDLLTDLSSLGKFRALAQFHSAIDGGLNFKRMALRMWKTPIEEGISKPLLFQYQRTYQASVPTAGEVIEGWQRGIYDDQAMIDGLRNHGYSYQRAVELVNIKQKQLAIADLAVLYQRGSLDDATLADLLHRQGYSGGVADLIGQFLKGRETDVLLKELVAAARKEYRAGGLAEDQLRTILQGAHLREDEIQLVLVVDALGLKSEKALTRTELVDAFKAALITEPDFRARLRTQRYSDADIDVLIALSVKQPTAAQIVEAASRGLIDRPVATARLERLGYSAADVEVLLALRGKSLTEGQVLDALGKGLINIQDAVADLQRLGYPQETIDVLLAFLRKTLSPAEIQAAVLRGLLTPEDAILRLTQAGYTRPDAELIVALRFRLLSVGQTLDAYGDGLLIRTDALADLQAKGFSLDDAQTLVRIFELKAEALKAAKGRAAVAGVGLRRRLLTVGETLDAFGNGLLTAEETLADLQALGFNAADAQLLVTLFETKRAARAARGAGGAPPPAGPPAPPGP